MKIAIVLSLMMVAAFAAPSSKGKKPFATLDLDRYWSLLEIYDYLDQLQEEYPEIAEVEVMGGTHEGRQIRGLRIYPLANLQRENVPVMFVTAGTSARDWISVMAAINIIHELAEHYEEFQNIIDDIEWFIIPVANPDGYEFSRLAGNRNWIKNRRLNQGSSCFGANIERNFVFGWGLDLSSSTDPCSDDFRGPSGDSEEETKTIQFAIDITQRIQLAYVTIRAGDQNGHSMILTPFSSNNEFFMPNFQEQVAVANTMIDAIWRQSGTRYRTASAANGIGLISGTSIDYATGQDQIPLAFTIVAPSGGANGWDVPEAQINRISSDIFTGVERLANYVLEMPMRPRQPPPPPPQ